MPRPAWIRDQAVDDDSPTLTPMQKGEVLARVVALGEAIIKAKGGRVDPGPVLMPQCGAAVPPRMGHPAQHCERDGP